MHGTPAAAPGCCSPLETAKKGNGALRRHDLRKKIESRRKGSAKPRVSSCCSMKGRLKQRTKGRGGVPKIHKPPRAELIGRNALLANRVLCGITNGTERTRKGRRRSTPGGSTQKLLSTPMRGGNDLRKRSLRGEGYAEKGSCGALIAAGKGSVNLTDRKEKSVRGGGKGERGRAKVRRLKRDN